MAIGQNEDANTSEEKIEISCTSKIFPLSYWKEWKVLCRQILGYTLMQFCGIATQPIAVIFGGRLGKIELDTVGLSNSLINISGQTVIIGMATACDTVLSQTFGSNNKKFFGIQFQKSLHIHGLALIVCICLHLNMEGILKLIGQDQEVARLSGRYLTLFIPGMMSMFLYNLIAKYAFNQNIVVPHVIISLIGIGFHILFQYLFIYQFNWGLDGSSLAQVGGYFLTMCMGVLYTLCSKMYKPTWPGWDRRMFLEWGEFTKLALYGLLMVGLEWWATEILIVLTGIVGTTELGAQTVVFNILSLFYSIPTGISIALSIRIGQMLGAGNSTGALHCSHVGYTFAGATSAVGAIIVVVFRNEIPNLFTNDPEVKKQSTEVLPLLAGYFIADAVCVVARGICRGCARQMVATLITFIGYYIFALPIGICLLFLTPLRVQGLWIGLVIAIGVNAVMYVVYISKVINWKILTTEARKRAKVEIEEADVQPIIENNELTKSTEETGLLEPTKKEIRSKEEQLGMTEVHFEPTSIVPNSVIVQKLCITFVFLIALAIALLCRLFIIIPHEITTEDCIDPSLNNTHLFFNTTLPLCNLTTPIPLITSTGS